MSRKEQAFSQAEMQIRKLLLERAELVQRQNHLLALLTYVVKTYGGEDRKLTLSKEQIDALDLSTEGVNLTVGERIVVMKYDSRVRQQVEEHEIECVCGGNASLEAIHTPQCEWWKRHVTAPRVAGQPADHKLCSVHHVLMPPGTPCSQCLQAATDQMECVCGRPKYRHLHGFGRCKDGDSTCEQFVPKIDTQA